MAISETILLNENITVLGTKYDEWIFLNITISKPDYSDYYSPTVSVFSSSQMHDFLMLNGYCKLGCKYMVIILC